MTSELFDFTRRERDRDRAIDSTPVEDRREVPAEEARTRECYRFTSSTVDSPRHSCAASNFETFENSARLPDEFATRPRIANVPGRSRLVQISGTLTAFCSKQMLPFCRAQSDLATNGKTAVTN